MSLNDNIQIKNSHDRIIIKDKRNNNLNILITKRNFNCSDINYFSIKQIHADKVFILDKKDKTFPSFEGDAIISTIKGGIGIKTADCLPIFIYSDNLSVIAVIHSGWRGTARKILEKTVLEIKNNLHINLKHLNFILGVAICKKCYNIKEDMYNEFIKLYGKSGNKFFYDGKFDIKGANLNILKDLGVEESQILNLNKCSSCNNNEFFSYRKENTGKRTLNIICKQ